LVDLGALTYQMCSSSVGFPPLSNTFGLADYLISVMDSVSRSTGAHIDNALPKDGGLGGPYYKIEFTLVRNPNGSIEIKTLGVIDATLSAGRSETQENSLTVQLVAKPPKPPKVPGAPAIASAPTVSGQALIFYQQLLSRPSVGIALPGP
jgi:hypothetical protein